MQAPRAALPPVDGATQQYAEAVMGPRRVPVDNAEFQISSNGYPPITSVPPAPAIKGPDSAQERLNDTKANLEADRSAAVTAAETLAKDAAAEPSLLSGIAQNGCGGSAVG